MRRLIVFASLLPVSAVAWAGDKPILRDAVPAWVRTVAAPAKSPPAGEAPVTLLLIDQQLRFEPGVVMHAGRSIVRIDTAQGLSAGNISLPWKPDTSDLHVHKLLIHRDGRTIDVLAGGQTFTVVRREANLENAMLDGVLTANIQPEGLQVGDTLEIVTTIVSRDPVLAGHAEGMTMIGAPLPVARAHLRASWPSRMAMRLRAGSALPAMRPVKEGDATVVEGTFDDLQPYVPPKLAPPRYVLGRLVEFSDYADWTRLGALFAPLYARAGTLPASGPLVEEVARIRAASADPRVRMMAALALAQDRVRYVALGMGDGGLVPADAATTWARRYGDCKAKTALLLAMLRTLGIAADPVVVNSAAGDGIDARLPAIGAFDHVLVRATIDGTAYWLDGTRTGDTAIARLEVPDFRWGLPLVPERAALVRMVPPPPARPLSDTEIAIDATAGLTVPAPVTIVETTRGDAAIGLKAAMGALAGEARTRALRDFWKRRYDFIDMEKSDAAFDAVTGEMRLTMAGKARMDWSSGWYETDGLGLGYRVDLDRDAGPDRDAPFAVAYPRYSRTVETIRLPRGFPATMPLDKVAIDRTIGGVEYRRQGAIRDRVFRAEATERSIASEFAAREAPAVQAALRAMADSRLYIRKPPSYMPSAAEHAVQDAVVPSTAEGWIERARSLAIRGRFDDAIANFDKAIALDGTNRVVLAQRGTNYAWKGDAVAAERDFARAGTEGYAYRIVLSGRGFLAEWRGDYAAAHGFYSKLLELDPADKDALKRRADVSRTMGKPADGLADLDRLITLDRAASEPRLTRINVLRSMGRTDDAMKAVTDMIAAADADDGFAHVAAARVYTAMGDRSAAARAFDRALAIRPEAYIYVSRADVRPRDDTAGRLADLDAALKLEPGFADALSGKADLLSDQRRYGEAVVIYDNALAANPDDAALLIRRGIAQSRNGAGAAAARDFAAARATIRGAGATEHNNLCWMLATAGVALDDALKDCDRALASFPTSPGYLDSRALVLLRLGRTADAVRDYDRALRGAPQQPTSLFGRGLARQRLGQRDAAAADLAAARKVDANIDDEFAGYGLKPDA